MVEELQEQHFENQNLVEDSLRNRPLQLEYHLSLSQLKYKTQFTKLSIRLGQLFVPISSELLTKFGSTIIAPRQILLESVKEAMKPPNIQKKYNSPNTKLLAG